MVPQEKWSTGALFVILMTFEDQNKSRWRWQLESSLESLRVSIDNQASCDHRNRIHTLSPADEKMDFLACVKWRKLYATSTFLGRVPTVSPKLKTNMSHGQDPDLKTSPIQRICIHISSSMAMMIIKLNQCLLQPLRSSCSLHHSHLESRWLHRQLVLLQLQDIKFTLILYQFQGFFLLSRGESCVHLHAGLYMQKLQTDQSFKVSPCRRHRFQNRLTPSRSSPLIDELWCW